MLSSSPLFVHLPHSRPPVRLWIGAYGMSSIPTAPLQPRGTSSSGAHPLIIKGILSFANADAIDQPFPCSHPSFTLCLLSFSSSGIAASHSMEPGVYKRALGSVLMNWLCLLCPHLIAHKLPAVGTQGLFVPARITCPLGSPWP